MAGTSIAIVNPPLAAGLTSDWIGGRRNFGVGQGTCFAPPRKISPLRRKIFRPSRQGRVQSEAGYTLVELLVVVAILGLLTLIATPFVLRYLDSAKVSTARTEIANISAGLDLFKIDIGRYPTTEEGLDALMKPPAGVDNWNGPYVKKATGLKDPWGRPYLYRSPGQHGEFDIYSYGAKGEASASGDKPQVANW
jgi:general secretion pathway protein G